MVYRSLKTDYVETKAPGTYRSSTDFMINIKYYSSLRIKNDRSPLDHQFRLPICIHCLGSDSNIAVHIYLVQQNDPESDGAPLPLHSLHN